MPRPARSMPGTAAARVPEVLIDDEIALVEKARQLGEVRVHERAVAPVAPRASGRRLWSSPGLRAASSLRARAAARRWAGLRGRHARRREAPRVTANGGTGGCGRGQGAHRWPVPRASSDADRRSDRRYRPLGGAGLDEAHEVGNDLLRQRSVGDVLAREGVLVHLGPHVAGIDGPHEQRRLLDAPAPRSGGRVQPWRARSLPSPA